MLRPLVVHVITGTSIGGAEMMLFRFIRANGGEAGNHLVVSLMPRGPIADMIESLGVEVIDLGAAGAAGIPAAVARLAALFARRRPAVVHGWMYHGSLVATLALLLGRQSRTGLVWGIHHSLADPANEKRMTRAVLGALRRLAPRADAITYCSREAARQHTAFGLSGRRARFVPNAIDMDEFRPDPAAQARLRAVAGVPEGRLIVGCVGRAHPMKDHAGFARTLALLAGRGIDLHGVLIGTGQPGGEAVRIAAEAGIGDRLTALPARGDVASLVPGFDVYLLSSAWGEALPLAVAEAMASGVPAVVTDVGDCGWLVGATGRVCPPSRPDLLADEVQDLLSLSPAKRAGLAAACRARVAQEMSMTEYVGRHAELYQGCRDHRAASSRQIQRDAA